MVALKLWLCRPSSRITKRRKRTPDKASSRGWSDQSFMDRMYRFTRIIADHKLISVLSAVPTMQQLDAASAFAPLHTPVAIIGDPFCPEALSGIAAGCMPSTRHFISICRMLPACFRYPGNCYPKVFSATAFTAFPANPSCSSLETTCQRRLIIAHLGNGASVSCGQEPGHRSTPAWGLTPSGGLVMGTRSASGSTRAC